MTWNLASGLEGKRVLVTGGAGGIGREVALAFGAAGSRVAVLDLDQEKVNSVVAEMQGGPHLPLAADLRPVAGHAGIIAAVVGAFGGLDVLVCAAAVLVRRHSVDEVTEADWDFQHEVNLKATFFLNQAAARVFRTQGRGGRIINFTSQGWWSGGFGGSVAYAASKGGIVSMTRGLARSFGPDKHHGECGLARRGRHGDDAQRHDRPATGRRRRRDPARPHGRAIGTGGNRAVSRLRSCRLYHGRDDQRERRLVDVLREETCRIRFQGASRS